MYSTFKYGNIINILLTLLSIVPVIKSFGHKKGHKKSHMWHAIKNSWRIHKLSIMTDNKSEN